VVKYNDQLSVRILLVLKSTSHLHDQYVKMRGNMSPVNLHNKRLPMYSL